MYSFVYEEPGPDLIAERERMGAGQNKGFSSCFRQGRAKIGARSDSWGRDTEKSGSQNIEGGRNQMKISYPVRIEKDEEGTFIVEGLEPLGNILTYGTTLEEAKDYAAEALTGVLGSMVDRGMEIPEPARPLAGEKNVYWISPDPKVGIPILIRKARIEAGLSLEEVARRAKVPYQSIQRWERSGTNPTISSLEKVFRAMGKKLDLEVAS